MRMHARVGVHKCLHASVQTAKSTKSSAHLTYLTASPRSAMQQVPFFFTKMFLDLMSLWAMAGFPAANKHAQLKSFSDYSQVTSSSPSLHLVPANPYIEASYPSQIPLLFFSYHL